MQVYKFKALTLAIALLPIIGSALILGTAPTQELIQKTEKSLSVSVIDVLPQAFTPSYQALGKIESPQLLTLSAQLEGEIVYVNEAFIEGGQLNPGDVIYKIDNNDYLHRLNQRKSELKIAQANYQIEQGEQKFAEKQYQQIRNGYTGKTPALQASLILRKPQLQKATANLAVAQSNVDIAERNLKRCKVISKLRFSVLKKSIVKGSFVNKGQSLGQLAQLSKLRVSLALPSEVVSQVSVNQEVEISTKQSKKYQAKISQISENLQANSQLQQIYLSIDNPQQTFILGEFIKARLELNKQQNTLKVPLASLDNGRLWVVNRDSRLLSRAVTIIWQDMNYAIINNVLASGESIVTSKLTNGRDGMMANIVSGVL